MAHTTADRTVRTALWASVALNAMGVLAFLPLALGRPSLLLPLAVPPYFAAQVGFTIALFGVVYAWLARQRPIHRPLLVVGGVGKLGFFLLTLVYALAGALPGRLVPSALPDLVFGTIFLWGAHALGRERQQTPERGNRA
jgi:hypothetical protein